MSDRLEDILDKLYWTAFSDADSGYSNDPKDIEEALKAVESYIDTEITKGLLKNPSKLRIGMLRQALNEDRITDPKKMIDNEYIEHWLGIAELKLKGEKI